MTGWFLFLAYFAAVNPPRLRPQLAAGEEPGQLKQLALGATMVAGAGLILVLAAGGILNALDITDETWRLATGVVCVLAGSRTVVAPAGGRLPVPAESVVFPIAFPLLFTPQLVVLAILSGATESFAAAWGWLATGVGTGVIVGRLRYRRPELWLALARLLATALVIVGVALIIAGIRDV